VSDLPGCKDVKRKLHHTCLEEGAKDGAYEERLVQTQIDKNMKEGLQGKMGSDGETLLFLKWQSGDCCCDVPGEPFGKAGAYGIQGRAAVFVKKLQGDYFNVVGFPLYDFAKHLEQMVDDGVLILP
jgi:hypothetical protein